MDMIQLIGSAMGLGFVAGLRLYSAILVLGLGLRFGLFHPPAGLAPHVGTLTSPLVLTAAAVAYLAEFFADKIPWVDSFWDAFHTFVRPIGAAMLGLAALGASDPALNLAVIILCGGVAFTSHGSKAATRFAVNHSPEPFSNIALSVSEDLFAPVGVWLSMKHPLLVLVLVLIFLSAFAWLSPRIFRLVRLQVTALRSCIGRTSGAPANLTLNPATLPDGAANALTSLTRCAEWLPQAYAHAVINAVGGSDRPAGIRCAAKRITGLRNSVGYLAISQDDLVFVARRLFRYRVHRINTKDVLSAEVKRGILVNRLILHTAAEEFVFYIFKNTRIADRAEADHERTALA
jgi:Domain of unknown function (DUF4126)